jgi:nitrous oxide reductase accessory protein NosL
MPIAIPIPIPIPSFFHTIFGIAEKMKTRAGVAIMLLLALIGLHIRAAERERCGQCGMDLAMYGRTQYEIIWIDGTATKTCGVQCGLTQQVKHRDKFKSSRAKDYFTGQLFDAQTGFYVFGSAIVADRAPGFIAFRQREDARKLQKTSGGRVMGFEEALSVWTKRLVRR